MCDRSAQIAHRDCRHSRQSPTRQFPPRQPTDGFSQPKPPERTPITLTIAEQFDDFDYGLNLATGYGISCSVASLALIVTARLRSRNFEPSCQTLNLCSPAGRLSILNSPLASVTAANGCSRGKCQANIHA